METVITNTEGIAQEVLDRLFAVLKSWADGMDAFRYEMFARRLVAAEYGRPDAVEWAQNWYNDLIAEEARQNETRLADRQLFEKGAAIAKAEFKAGRCGNPHYQAFLDTLEHPELLENNAPYFAWLSGVTGKFNRQPGVKKLDEPERDAAWRQFLQKERDENLALRLNGKPNPLKFRN